MLRAAAASSATGVPLGEICRRPGRCGAVTEDVWSAARLSRCAPRRAGPAGRAAAGPCRAARLATASLDRIAQRRVGLRERRVGRLRPTPSACAASRSALALRVIGAANVRGALQGAAERLPLDVRELVRLRERLGQRAGSGLRVFVLQRVAERLRQRLGGERFAHRGQRLVAQVGIGVGQLLVELVLRARQDRASPRAALRRVELGLGLLQQLVQLVGPARASGWRALGRFAQRRRAAALACWTAAPARRPAGRARSAAGWASASSSSVTSAATPRATSSIRAGRQCSSRSRRALREAVDGVGALQADDRLTRSTAELQAVASRSPKPRRVVELGARADLGSWPERDHRGDQ